MQKTDTAHEVSVFVVIDWPLSAYWL